MSDNSGPAFPQPVTASGEAIMGDSGMSLRDYFAAKAMQGFAARGYFSPQSAGDIKCFTVEAYKIADAMLEVRLS